MATDGVAFPAALDRPGGRVVRAHQIQTGLTLEVCAKRGEPYCEGTEEPPVAGLCRWVRRSRRVLTL